MARHWTSATRLRSKRVRRDSHAVLVQTVYVTIVVVRASIYAHSGRQINSFMDALKGDGHAIVLTLHEDTGGMITYVKVRLPCLPGLTDGDPLQTLSQPLEIFPPEVLNMVTAKKRTVLLKADQELLSITGADLTLSHHDFDEASHAAGDIYLVRLPKLGLEREMGKTEEIEGMKKKIQEDVSVARYMNQAVRLTCPIKDERLVGSLEDREDGDERRQAFATAARASQGNASSLQPLSAEIIVRHSWNSARRQLSSPVSGYYRAIRRSNSRSDESTAVANVSVSDSPLSLK